MAILAASLAIGFVSVAGHDNGIDEATLNVEVKDYSVEGARLLVMAQNTDCYKVRHDSTSHPIGISVDDLANRVGL